MKRWLKDPRALLRAAVVAAAGGLTLWSVALMLGRKGPVERRELRPDADAPLFASSEALPAAEERAKARDSLPSILPVLSDTPAQSASARKESRDEGAGSATPSTSTRRKGSKNAELDRIIANKFKGEEGNERDADSKDSPAGTEEAAPEQGAGGEEGAKPALQKMPSKFQSADRASGGFSSAGMKGASAPEKPRLSAASLSNFLSQASNRAFMAPKIGGALKALTGGGRRALDARGASRQSLRAAPGASAAGPGGAEPPLAGIGGGGAAAGGAGGGGGGGGQEQPGFAGGNRAAVNAGGGGGGGGNFGGLPMQGFRKVGEPEKHADKQDRAKIQERADRHLAAANKYKKEVVIPWSHTLGRRTRFPNFRIAPAWPITASSNWIKRSNPP